MDEMKLYQYTESFQNVLNLLEDEEYTYDDLKDTLEAIQMSAEDKIKNTGKIIQKMNDNITILTEHKKRIDGQIKSEKKKVESLKSYLLHNMQQLQVKSVKDPLINVSLRNSTSLVFTNEDKIPEEWIKVKTEAKPDKEGFKKWYKSLSEEEQSKVDYAFIETNQNVQIK